MNLTAFTVITLWKILWRHKPVSGAVGRLCGLLQTAGGMFWAWHQAPEIWWRSLIPAPRSVTPYWELESATVRNQQMPQMCKAYQPGQFFFREAVVKLFSSTPAAAGRAWVYSTPTLKGPSLCGCCLQGRGLELRRGGLWPAPSVNSVQFSRSVVVQLSATPWTAAHQASLSITTSQSLLKLTSIESMTPSNHFILCHPLLLLPSIFPSSRVFPNKSVLCIGWPKYWSFSFSISPSNEYSGLISFRMDWLDLLAVQETLKSLLQHHSSKASILQSSAFFIVQLSHPYMTTGKTIALTRQTFVDKVMSLLFNMLSRLVIAFLPRNKHLLISWLQSPSAVIWEPPQNKICHCFHCFPIYLPWIDVTGCHEAPLSLCSELAQPLRHTFVGQSKS